MRLFTLLLFGLALACGGGSAPATSTSSGLPPADASPVAPSAAVAVSTCTSACEARRVADAWSSELIAAECAAECGEGKGLVEVAEEDPKSWVVNGKVDAVDLPWMDQPDPAPIWGVHTASGTSVAFACDLSNPAKMGTTAWLTAQRNLGDFDGITVLADCITPLNAVSP